MPGFNLEDWFNKKAQIVVATAAYAQFMKALHTSLVDEGFSEDQAMQVIEITMRHFMRAVPELVRVMNEMNGQ